MGYLLDLRFALRSLRRTPAFTAIAVVTLALGIGANVSSFSIVNALLLRPLPYPDSEQLHRMFRVTEQNARGNFSPADYLDLQSASGSYGQVAAYGVADMSLAEPGRAPEMAAGLRASANLFSLLGVEPALGRTFRRDEDVPGRDDVAVISHRLWQNRFGADPAIVGRVVRVDGEPHEIVGVLPPAFNEWRHLGPFDLFKPLALTDTQARNRSETWLRIIGRRSGTVSAAQAEGVIAAFGSRMAAEHPAVNTGASWRARPIIETVIPPNARGVLGMLIGLSSFVMLIACSNLANLLLTRAMVRAREFALRAALGASRARLLRPLALEALLLAAAGGLGATWVARATNAWLNAFSSPATPVVFVLDWRVLGWSAMAGFVTAIVFGVAPALFALRLDLNRTLRSGSRGISGGRGQQRFRQLLIAGQFAFAMVLLAGAALFARGLQDLNERDYGWAPERLMAGSVVLPPAKYADASQIAAFHTLAIQRLEQLPGVASASVSAFMPFFAAGQNRKLAIEGRPAPEVGREPVAVLNSVSARYFETAGMPLVEGRGFTDRDTTSSPAVFIVNASMARTLFPGESPIGRRVAEVAQGAPQWGEIVGIVGDIESVFPDRVGAAFQLYRPMAQAPLAAHEIAVRSATVAPANLAVAIRDAIAAIDPDLPIQDLRPATDALLQATNYPRIIGKLLAFLATLGLGLALLGVFGVISRLVAQRRGEFGVRLALGADRGDIVRLVLGSGTRVAVAGSAIGMLGALGVSRLIAAGWPGMTTSAVSVLPLAALALITLGLLASYIPARSASRTNPLEALRAE